MSPCNLLALPDGVLKLILQHVSLKERLGSCCLVSRRLHAAAMAATDALQIMDSANTGPGSALAWLCQYGSHLTSLRLYGDDGLYSELPCRNLRSLEVWNGSVLLWPEEDAHPGVLQGIYSTKLTALELRCNTLDAPEGSVLDLSGLTSLQCLLVTPTVPRYAFGGLSAATLYAMRHLTHLEVNHLSADNLLQLRALTSLLELGLWNDFSGPAADPSSIAGVSFPASLTLLRVHPAAQAGLLPLLPAGLCELQLLGGVEGPADSPGSWLSSIGRLQQLSELVLQATGDMQWPPAGPEYSALTASSSLEVLLLCDFDGPGGIWPHVFPAARTLPHLTRLDVTSDLAEGGHTPASAWGAADLASLTSCCVNLCHANLMLRSGRHVSVLSNLTGLTTAYLHYGWDLHESWGPTPKALATLTQLQELSMTLEGSLFSALHSPTALWPLTSLTGLSRLSVFSGESGESDSEVEEDEWTWLSCAQVPDVWLQLLQRCAQEPGFQPTLMRSP